MPRVLEGGLLGLAILALRPLEEGGMDAEAAVQASFLLCMLREGDILPEENSSLEEKDPGINKMVSVSPHQ